MARWHALRDAGSIRVDCANMRDGVSSTISHGEVSRGIGTEFCIARASRSIGEAVRAAAGENRAKPCAAPATRKAPRAAGCRSQSQASQTLGVVASACVRYRRECMSEMQWANEMMSGCIDGRRHTRRFGKGRFGTRAAEAEEGAARAALASISEDASSVKERRILRELALVFAGADAHVCPQVNEKRTQDTSTTTKGRRASSGCAREHNSPRMTRGDVGAFMANFCLYLP